MIYLRQPGVSEVHGLLLYLAGVLEEEVSLKVWNIIELVCVFPLVFEFLNAFDCVGILRVDVLFVPFLHHF